MNGTAGHDGRGAAAGAPTTTWLYPEAPPQSGASVEDDAGAVGLASATGADGVGGSAAAAREEDAEEELRNSVTTGIPVIKRRTKSR